MATLSVIRRWALREQLSIREIARRTGLSRNTIKKYLRAGAAEPRYAKRISPSKLDPFADKLSGWLKSEAIKSRKQRRTLKQMHADLVLLGFDGSYNRVAAFARAWTAQRHEAEQTTGRGTFVPLTFGAGEAFQFDWSEAWAVIGGERTKLQGAHFKLSHSRAFLLRAYPLQTYETLFDAHNHAFEVLGGVPRRGIYDNMRTAVDKVRRGKERDINARFQAMVSHYLFEVEFCNPASGWEKGQVEKNVRDARHRLWQPTPVFPTLDALNDWLAVLQKKPGALRNGAPFAELPEGFKRLQASLLKQPGGDREMVEILALVLHHDGQAVLIAVELALEAGVPTKMHVLNVLHRLLDGKPPAPTINAPQALRLVNEPQANVLRYDALRGPGKAQASHALAAKGNCHAS